jgi:hypothetical protein
VTSDDIYELLKARFGAPEWALLPQVANATGGGAIRYADAVAVSLWPSRGIEIHGFEIKVERRDWKRELANPAKADAVGSFCDRWWVVAPEGVVPAEELPVAWGLLESRPNGDAGHKLWTRREPGLLEPQPLTRAFVAALIRRVYGVATPEAKIRKLVDAARAEAFVDGQNHDREQSARINAAYEELEQRVDAFERASGVLISRWPENAGAIGHAVAAVLRADKHNLRRLEAMLRAAESAARIAEELRQELKTAIVQLTAQAKVGASAKGTE